jgi:hypothetical protein
MSLSVNSVTSQAYAQSPSSQSQSSYQSLANALQSGNLTAAQTAFATFEQSFQDQTGNQTASASHSNTINNDLQSLSNALNSGNLTSAQQAFAQLQKDMTTEQTGRHRHHGSNEGAIVNGLIAPLASASNSTNTTGNTLNVTA